jgi:flagellin-like protein
MLNIKKMMKKKGISPVIASIILIAITVAVAIAVAGWVFGLFGTYGTAGGVSVVGPSLTLSDGTWTFSATVTNSKDTSVSATSVTATGNGGVAVSFTLSSSGPYAAHSTGGALAATVAQDTTPQFTPGNTYSIKVSFSDGTIVNVIVTAS